jgi:hypothetical protein
MHRRILMTLPMLLAAALTNGCGQKEEKPPLVPPENPGTAEELAGTTWEVEGYVLAFEEPPEVHISGEAVPFPGGVDGSFSVENGIIRVGALGRSHEGTWDGVNLVFEGVAAAKSTADDTAGETGDEPEADDPADAEAEPDEALEEGGGAGS